MKEIQPDKLSELAWGIAHPARVAILRFLRERGSCVCGAIAGQLPLAQSTVSQHLKILRDAGLIKGEIDGPRVCYCIDEENLALLKEIIADL